MGDPNPEFRFDTPLGERSGGVFKAFFSTISGAEGLSKNLGRRCLRDPEDPLTSELDLSDEDEAEFGDGDGGGGRWNFL